MQPPKIDVQQQKLAGLLHEMENGKLQVPRFQRKFVWPLKKTRDLLDSMYKEFPIGTFFLWRAPLGSPSLFRPLADELGIPGPQKGVEVSYILDGQQRLASLYVTIKGLKCGSRNYGRISIDLETATRYDQNQDEGFDEDIFVSRSGDNRRPPSRLFDDEPYDLVVFAVAECWRLASGAARDEALYAACNLEFDQPTQGGPIHLAITKRRNQRRHSPLDSHSLCHRQAFHLLLVSIMPQKKPVFWGRARENLGSFQSFDHWPPSPPGSELRLWP